MIDLAYIIESADRRMYEACPEITTPDVKPYKPVLKIKYKKPRRIGRRKGTAGHHSKTLPCEKWCGRRSCADISRAAKRAREEGISYGAFMAKKRGNAKI